jgi:glycosyltransferase involved in cell wall biosynthesis
MIMDVPILARRGTAVSHTLGDAGVQFEEAPIDEVAEMAWQLANDEELRRAVIGGQRERVKRFAPDAVQADLRRAIGSL